MYHCISDRYDPGSGHYGSLDDFLAMCQAAFGEQPELRLAQPVEADDVRRPREVQLLLEQLAAVGLTLVPLGAQRHLPDGAGATNSQLRRAVGIAGSFHVALKKLKSS